LIYPASVRSLFALCLASSFALCLTACVNTDPTVFVDPAIEAPAATVSGGVLGTSLTGSFKLTLHLGPRATGPSQVSLGAFSILDAEQKGAIVASLPLQSSTTFPVTVELDSDVSVDLTFDTGSNTLPIDAQTALCDPAGVVIGGTIQDSLQNTATPVTSGVFKPTCM